MDDFVVRARHCGAAKYVLTHLYESSPVVCRTKPSNSEMTLRSEEEDADAAVDSLSSSSAAARGKKSLWERFRADGSC